METKSCAHELPILCPRLNRKEKEKQKKNSNLGLRFLGYNFHGLLHRGWRGRFSSFGARPLLSNGRLTRKRWTRRCGATPPPPCFVVLRGSCAISTGVRSELDDGSPVVIPYTSGGPNEASYQIVGVNLFRYTCTGSVDIHSKIYPFRDFVTGAKYYRKKGMLVPRCSDMAHLWGTSTGRDDQPLNTPTVSNRCQSAVADGYRPCTS